MTERFMERALPAICDNLRRYLAGRPLRILIDAARGYRELSISTEHFATPRLLQYVEIDSLKGISAGSGAMRRQLAPITLTLLFAAMFTLGTRRVASGAGCVVQARQGCSPQEAAVPIGGTQLRQPAGAGQVSAGPPQPSDALLALHLSILSGNGLPQAGPTQLRATNVSARLHWPVSGPITQPYGVPELGVGLPHTGIDIGQAPGSPVRASQAGRVAFAGGDPCCGLGYWVDINHGDGYSTRYGHLMRPPVVLPGDFVNQGQVLGFSGDTGFSTGPHVHFEVRDRGIPVDPLRLIPPS